MLSFNPFTSVTGRNAYTLFEIRLENDFIVFRGNEDESSGQLLKGTVVLCLPAPLKVEDVHLRLTGVLRYSWTDTRPTPTGIGSLDSGSLSTATRGTTLAAGNYEWPFELMLPGNTCESVEGLPEASLTYKLKATVARGKLAYDLHVYKRLRIIRTLEPSALEFLHAMSVENIWPNKIEYSIVVPQKAVVFGSTIPLETRFTPLLKGLDLGDISIQLIEVHDVALHGLGGHILRNHKKEKEAAHWTIPMSRDEHWHDMIEDTGQEGWVMKTSLDLPRKLGRCLQDVTVHGIKVRHKLKLVVALKNPDGHVSELRATLPVTIFISPNMPLDEEGNLVRHLPAETATTQGSTTAPPVYGEHILDELYDDLEPTGLQTPGVQSGVNSPFYMHSRAGSAENLAGMMTSMAVPPAALTSRLQNMTLDSSHRNNSFHGRVSGSGGISPHPLEPYQPSLSQSAPQSAPHSAPQSAPQSAPLSRRTSGEHSLDSENHEHLDFSDMTELTKVPSYHTAVRTPVRPLDLTESSALPDYETAMSAPPSPTLTHTQAVDPLAIIPEVSHELREPREPSPVASPGNTGRSRQSSLGIPLAHEIHAGELDERRRLHLLRTRDRLV